MIRSHFQNKNIVDKNSNYVFYRTPYYFLFVYPVIWHFQSI